MLLYTLAALTALAPDPSVLEMKVVSAAMFKNGYAVVIREAPVKAAGRYRIAMPGPSGLGTLWFSASDGLSMDQIVTSRNREKQERPIESLVELLQINKGKSATLLLNVNKGDEPLTVSGKILSVAPEATLLQTEKGVMAISTRDVRMVLGIEGGASTASRDTEKRYVDFILSGAPKGAGNLRMITLDQGLTWVPGYRIDLTDPKNALITMKCTMMNDLTNLSGIEARFVTGFPNLPFRNVPEPLTSGLTVNAFLNSLRGIGLEDDLSFGRAGEMMMNQAPAAPGRPGAGGLGGGLGPVELPPEQLEDLFFYRLGNVTLNAGERAYFTMLEFRAPYEEVYTWDVDVSEFNSAGGIQRAILPQAQSVWHAVRFKNQSNQPLTTAAATTVKSGATLGQDMLRYTSAGAESEVRVTKTLDIRVQAQEEEVTRERGVIKRRDLPSLDLVTMKGTFVLENLKPEQVAMRVRHAFAGELVSGDGDPDSIKAPAGLGDANPNTRVEWELSLEPGEKRTVTFTYKVYVPSMGM